MKKQNILLTLINSFILTIFFCTTVTAKEITIFTTNDLHGRVKSFDYLNQKDVGGAARRATILKNNPNALILDAGDFAQGTLYFKIFDENINLKLLEKQSYDAITLGNHELDKGINYLKKSAFSTQIPMLAANVKFKDKELNKKIKPYIIKEINDLKIGIIGVIDKTTKVQCSANPNHYFIQDDLKAIKKIAKKIDKKTDLIIVLSHVGVERDKIIAQNVPNIDLIIGGHSHTMLEKPIKINNILISQNGEFGTNLGKWTLEVNNDKIESYKFEQIPINKNISKDDEIEKFLKQYDAEINKYTKTIAGSTTTTIDARRNTTRKSLTTAGALLHQAIKYHYPDVEISMNTSGGYRYGDFLPQKLTYKDISELFPFDSYLIILDIKGSDIISILESSSRFLPKPSSSFLQTHGITYTVNLNNSPQVLSNDLTKIIKKGNRVSDIFINGTPINPHKTYRLATDNFLFFGGDGYVQLKKYKNVKHTEYFLDKILIDYLEKKSPIEVILKDKIYLK